MSDDDVGNNSESAGNNSQLEGFAQFVFGVRARSRNAALEEAAKACDELMKDHDDSFGMIVAPDACAAAIRALKTP